jgi:uncharacterized protein (TIGR02271 family)
MSKRTSRKDEVGVEVEPPSRPQGSETGDVSVVRREEELAGVETAWRGIGYVRAHKRVATYRIDEDMPRQVETVALERQPVDEDDSGRVERLPDGSISIPVFEEELVVEKRVVLKERVIIRKETITEVERIRDELRTERVEIEADAGIEIQADEPGRH